MRNNIMHHQLQTLDSPSVITFSTERPRMLVPRSFIAQNAPTESCRCTTRIPWYHQNPAYTHRILFALTAWNWPPVRAYHSVYNRCWDQLIVAVSFDVIWCHPRPYLLQITLDIPSDPIPFKITVWLQRREPGPIETLWSKLINALTTIIFIANG